MHDLITDEEINVCSHIFHILAKMVDWTASRNCIPFCRLISRILKLKSVHPSQDERPYPRPSLINIHTLHTSMSHTKKSTKQGSHATPGSSSSTSHAYHALLTHSLRHQVHISADSDGPNSKEARGTWRLVIPWQKGGDGVVNRGSVVIGGGEASSCCLVYSFYCFSLCLSTLFLISVLYSVFVFISMLCSIFFVLLRYC